MADAKQLYYNKRGEILVKNLKSRHFDAYYCESKEDALEKAMELIPKGASVAWGGALSADQIGLTEAVRSGSYHVIDRSAGRTVCRGVDRGQFPRFQPRCFRPQLGQWPLVRRRV